jgi:hypothetical protein
MRRRDILFVCAAFGGVVAGLAWALSTQSRWVRENRASQVPPQQPGADAPGPPPAKVTGVIGTVTDATRTSLAKDLVPPKPQPGETARRPVPQDKQGPASRDLRSPATPGRVSTQP